MIINNSLGNPQPPQVTTNARLLYSGLSESRKEGMRAADQAMRNSLTKIVSGAVAGRGEIPGKGEKKFWELYSGCALLTTSLDASKELGNGLSSKKLHERLYGVVEELNQWPLDAEASKSGGGDSGWGVLRGWFDSNFLVDEDDFRPLWDKVVLEEWNLYVEKFLGKPRPTEVKFFQKGAETYDLASAISFFSSRLHSLAEKHVGGAAGSGAADVVLTEDNRAIRVAMGAMRNVFLDSWKVRGASAAIVAGTGGPPAYAPGDTEEEGGKIPPCLKRIYIGEVQTP